MVNVSELSSQDIFDLWRIQLKEDGANRFLYKERMEHIDSLVNMFKNANVDLIEAKRFSKKVVDVLVTKEGRTEKQKKHKGWSATVEKNYNDSLLAAYVDIDKLQEIPQKEVTQSIQDVENNTYIMPEEYDLEIIKSWVIDRYNGVEHIYDLASNPTSDFYIMFLKDKYGEYL